MTAAMPMNRAVRRQQRLLVVSRRQRRATSGVGYFWFRPKSQVGLPVSFQTGSPYIMKWRWDQGRLTYFAVDNMRATAKVLQSLDGVIIEGKGPTEDPLDKPLKEGTGLPFKRGRKNTHTIWRNYKRVFECSMLASAIDGRLHVSEICTRFATNDEYGADEYLYDFIPRFVYPYPAFDKEQKPEGPEVFPFCAIGKLLMSATILGKRGITLSDVFTKLIGNKVTGVEDLEFYGRLQPTNYQPEDNDEKRQLREMLVFCGQLSFMKWTGSELMLDLSKDQLVQSNFLSDLFLPRPIVAGTGPLFYRLTSLDAALPKPFNSMPTSLDDDIFLEGGKNRVSHLRIERSPLLRRMYINANPEPYCHTCERDMRDEYPWTVYMIEVHHLLPLNSPLVVKLKGTSLDDVAGVCPNCHKSIHAFYGVWLKERDQHDFKSKEEARSVYEIVKNEIHHD